MRYGKLRRLFSDSLLEAYQITGNPEFGETGSTTLDYILREMTRAQGGYFSSQDADSQGVDGRFYVWDSREIYSILDKDSAEIFCDIYGVSPEGNWEGRNILYRRRNENNAAKAYGVNEQDLKQILIKLRNKLYEIRQSRNHLFTDDKILTSWNGLMISAMCKGFQVLHHEKYLESAESAVKFILEHLVDENRVFHCYHLGVHYQKGFLEDYSFLIAALLDLYETTFKPEYLEKASILNEIMLEKFWDAKRGGLLFTSHDHEKLIARTYHASDNALPSGYSVAVGNLFRLSEFSSDYNLKSKAEHSLKLFYPQMTTSPMSFPAFMSSMDYIWGKLKQIIITWDPGDLFYETMSRIHKTYLPNKILGCVTSAIVKSNPGFLKKFPILLNKFQDDLKMKLYVCEGSTCHAPFTSRLEVMNFLQSLKAPVYE